MGDNRVVDEKDAEQRPEKGERRETPAVPAGPVSAARVNAVIEAWIVLTALAAGGTVFFLAPQGSSMQKALGGARYLTPMTAVGLGVAAAFWWGIHRFLRSRIPWAKPGEGAWVRWVAYAGVASLALFAAVSIYHIPDYQSPWYKSLWEQVVFGKAFAVKPVLFPSAFVGLALVLGFHGYANGPKPSEFLVETQSELRKVSWPATKEWVGSTIVVLVVMSVMALFLHFTDLGLSAVLKWLKIGI